MMTPDIHQAYEALPPELQREAADFIEFLTQKWRRRSASQPTADDITAGRFGVAESAPDPQPTLAEIAAGRRATLGKLQGQIWMAEDFDEPLDDFKDYM